MFSEMLQDKFINVNTKITLKGEDIKRLIQIEDARNKDKQLQGFRKKRKRDDTNMEITEMLGGDFIQQNYIQTIFECLADNGDFDSAFAFRLTYLTTYMNFNNILVFDASNKRITRFIEEKDLKDVMGLAPKQLMKFKNLCFNSGILEYETIEGIQTLKINKKVACKGKIPSEYKRNSIRVSVPHFQQLYKTATSRQHKKLGYLIPLLPNVNYEYSILCLNPSEEYKNYLEPLSSKEICKIVNYNPTKASRLLTELRGIIINEEQLLYTVTSGNNEAFFLNPKVFFKGVTTSSITEVKELFNLAQAFCNRNAHRFN